jgi:hypothetical protein
MMNKQSLRISIVSPLLILCGVLLSGSSACAQSADKTCSNRTLSGHYGFAIEGVASLGGQIGVLRGVAMTHFDGEGHLSQVDHVVVNGAPAPMEAAASIPSIRIAQEQLRSTSLTVGLPYN